ncbi:ABC transporter substrate-binding protein [Cohnella sp.]|uniref:ABC transporter substrate-binding protein n=1 Tax=Cohnella sp. TaxID=1883426 RepID=UPI003704D394
MKKWIAVWLVIIVVAVMSGCGQSNSNGKQEGSNPPANNGKQEITILGNARMYDGEENAWNEVAAAFQQETGIKVNLRWQGKWNEVPQNLNAAKLSGENIDLVTVGAGLINSSAAPSGMLMDITTLLDPYRDRFNDGMLKAYEIGGKLWGFPYGNSSAGFIYYNKTIFKELQLNEPKTFEELVAASKTIREKKNILPMIFRGKDASFWPNLYMSTYAQATGNKATESVQDFLAGKKEFAGDAEKQAFEWIKAFFDQGVLTNESFGTDGDGMRATFLQQKAAMMHTHTFNLTQEQTPDFELGIMEFPLMAAGGQAFSQPFGGPGTGIAVPSFADRGNLSNTVKFIEFLLRPENANKIISRYQPTVQVVKGVDVLKSEIIDKLNNDLIPKTTPYLDWIWPAEVNTAFSSAVPAFVAGKMTSEEAVRSIQSALDKIIKERNYRFEWWTELTEDDWKKMQP